MTTDTAQTLSRFLDADGRLHTIPSKRSKLLIVLAHLARSFEPGRSYVEPEINTALQGFHPDHAALRRYLVEAGFMTREGGRYRLVERAEHADPG